MGVPVKTNTLYPPWVSYPPTQKSFMCLSTHTSPNVLARPVMHRFNVKRLIIRDPSAPTDQLGLTGRIFVAPKPLMDKQVYLIPRVD